eukprot:7053701-Prymnesium_polylepis.1
MQQVVRQSVSMSAAWQPKAPTASDTTVVAAFREAWLVGRSEAAHRSQFGRRHRCPPRDQWIPAAFDFR